MPSPSLQPDVDTVEGFFHAYDRRAGLLKRARDWCSVDHAYNFSGDSDLFPGHKRAPAPYQRDHLTRQIVDASLLNEAGQAWLAEQAAKVIHDLRLGALTALKYGLENGYVLVEGAHAACVELGLPDLTMVRGRNSSVSAHIYFVSEGYLAPGEQRTELETEVRAVAESAIFDLLRAKGYVPSLASVETRSERYDETISATMPAEF